MRDAILIQHAHLEGDGGAQRAYQWMLDEVRDRHAEYCQRHGFDYDVRFLNDPRYPADSGAWIKLLLIIEALEKGYRHIVFMDPDAIIWDTEADLREAVRPGRIGVCWHRIPQLHHWNVGVMYLANSPGILEFMRSWLSSYPPPPDGWNEQGVFNRMARQSRIVETLSDRWNATVDVNMVPDAVVLAFHGQGPGTRRLDMIRRALGTLPVPVLIPERAVNE